MTTPLPSYQNRPGNWEANRAAYDKLRQTPAYRAWAAAFRNAIAAEPLGSPTSPAAPRPISNDTRAQNATAEQTVANCGGDLDTVGGAR